MYERSHSPCSADVPVVDPLASAHGAGTGPAPVHEGGHPNPTRRRWTELLLGVYRRLDDDHVGMLSGGVAFFGVLSVFPGIVALISLYGLVSDPTDVATQIRALSTALPLSARRVLAEQLTRLVRTSETGLSISLVISTILLVLSASGGAHATMEGINIAYRERDTRSYLKRRWRALLFTLLFLLSTLLAVAAVTLLPRIVGALGLGGNLQSAAAVLRWPVLGLYVAGGLSVLYRYAPDRRQRRWQWVLPGSTLATGLWLSASMLLTVYVNLFGRFSAVYGAVAGVVVLLLWFYLSSYAVLLGAEFNSELESPTHRSATGISPAREASKTLAKVLGNLPARAREGKRN